jgi:hypothetical protein
MGCGSGLDELNEVLDRLAALDVASLDVSTLTQDELRALVGSVQLQRSRLALAAADVLVVWEQHGGWAADGSLNAGLALGRDTRSCHRSARFELRRARLLQQLPCTRVAVAAGRLSMDVVDLFVRTATAARLEWFIAHEAELVAMCERLVLFDDVRRLLAYWAIRADDELGLGREKPAPSTLYASRSGDTGESWWNGHFGAIDTEIVQSELTRLMKEIKLDDTREGVRRTRAQLRAAALVLMATRSINATGVTARPLFEVIVGDLTARRLCELASGHVVHPEDLVPFIDDAVMEMFLFDGPTVIIAKTHQRTFRGALRKAIKVRDRRCQHESVCPAPAAECDIDHRTPAARGGPTSQFNGHAECLPHNRLEHLHDQPDEQPERPIGILDLIRCKARWYQLNHLDDLELDEAS